MQLQQIEITGSRLVGAITGKLGMDGPKHHAVILGKCTFDGEIYIAEMLAGGRQIATLKDFQKRYEANGQLRLEPNNGPNNNAQVAQRAIAELEQGGPIYDLLLNNCESFVNRAMHGNSNSSQIVNTAFGIAALFGFYYILKKSK